MSKINHISDYYKLKKNELKISKTITTTGYEHLDELICGFEKGELITIAGRPNMKRNELAYNLMFNISSNNVKVGYVSFNKLYNNFINTLSKGTSRNKTTSFFPKATFSDEDLDKFLTNKKDLSTMDLFIVESSTKMFSEIKDHIINLINVKNVEVVFLDEVQLIQNSSKFHLISKEELNKIIIDLKYFAVEKDISIVIISHLSREVDFRYGDKMPMLCDISISDNIEIYSDKILLSHIPEVWGITEGMNGEDMCGITEIIVEKNNKGERGLVRLNYDKETSIFTSREKSVDKFSYE